MSKVFVADGNEGALFLIEEFLPFMGYDVCGKAYDGKEAIRKFGELDECPNIGLLEYQRLFLRGLEVATRILKSYPNCKIIKVSGLTDIKIKARDLGVKCFIEKPFEYNLLNHKEII